MTKTKRFFSSLMAVAMIFTTLLTTAVPSAAATKSNGIKTQTITVTTSNSIFSPSITLKQTKGTCTEKTYNIFKKKTVTKTSQQYGEWDISVKATDGSHSYTKTLTGSSIKLSLKANKTYKITITWDSTAAIFKELDKGSYTTYPTWSVKSTSRIKSYS